MTLTQGIFGNNSGAVQVQGNPQFTRGKGASSDYHVGTRNTQSSILNTGDVDLWKKNVEMLLGPESAGLRFEPNNRAMDVFHSSSHTTTGLPYALNGTAAVFDKKLIQMTADFDDPIFGILPITYADVKKVIITRTAVVGGRAMALPERTAGRVPSIKETHHPYYFQRIGNEIEMNMNLFHVYERAEKELNMKMLHEKGEIQRALMDSAYATCKEEGVQLMSAILRNNPTYSLEAGVSNKEIVSAYDKKYITSIFACMNKQNYPIQNLMASAAYAGMYSPPQKARKLILPVSVTTLQHFTRREFMDTSISGLSPDDPRKKVPLQVPNFHYDPNANVYFSYHRPPPTYELGATNPTIPQSALTDIESWGTFYSPVEIARIDTTETFGSWALKPTDQKDIQIMNFASGAWTTITTPNMMAYLTKTYLNVFNQKKISDEFAKKHGITRLDTRAAGDEHADTAEMMKSLKGFPYLEGTDIVFRAVLVRPQMTATMSSGLLFTDGPDEIGSMVVAFPHSSVSTHNPTETYRIMHRTHIGTVMYSPERIMVLNNIAFEGLNAGYRTRLAHLDGQVPNGAGTKDADNQMHDFSTKMEDGTKDIAWLLCSDKPSVDFPYEFSDGCMTFSSNFAGAMKDYKALRNWPLKMYQGAHRERHHSTHVWEVAQANVGHLGRLDSPEGQLSLWGQQVYDKSMAP